jgi:hypothetical protein
MTMVGKAAPHSKELTNAGVEEATAEKIKSAAHEKPVHSCDAS